jgi:MFS family permease
VASPTTAKSRSGLWGHPDFLKLWAGQSLSLFGSQVTTLALPLVAVVALGATATEMGVLGALARAPMVLFLFAGVWADRVRRRPTMIWTDIGRGLMIATIPALFLADRLSIGWLYLVVFVVGVLSVFFEVANQANLPALVGREHIPEGNGKMQISNSVAQAAGPSLAGLLVTYFSAAAIVVIDAVSYFASAVCCALIRKPEEKPGGESQRGGVFAAIAEGVRWLWAQPLLRPMMYATAFYMFFVTGVQTLFVIYLVEDLRLSGLWLGVVLAAIGVGMVVGALFSVKILMRVGPGPAAFWSTVAGNTAFLLIPLASGPLWLAVAMLALSQLLVGLTTPIAQVGMGSLRQVLTPDELQGRVVATFRALSLGLAPVGALLAGLLGAAIGLRPTMWVLAVGALIPIAVIYFSPIPGTRQFPGR